jgi:hypothetical protein
LAIFTNITQQLDDLGHRAKDGGPRTPSPSMTKKTVIRGGQRAKGLTQEEKLDGEGQAADSMRTLQDGMGAQPRTNLSGLHDRIGANVKNLQPDGDPGYETVYAAKDVIIVRTKYWEEEQCEAPNMCILPHRVLSLRKAPQRETMPVVLWRCTELCSLQGQHTHSTSRKDAYFLHFRETETGDDRQNDIAIKYDIQDETDDFVYIRTHFWIKKVHDCLMRACFAPDAKMQPTFEIVALYKCDAEDCQHRNGIILMGLWGRRCTIFLDM